MSSFCLSDLRPINHMAPGSCMTCALLYSNDLLRYPYVVFGVLVGGGWEGVNVSGVVFGGMGGC